MEHKVGGYWTFLCEEHLDDLIGNFDRPNVN